MKKSRWKAKRRPTTRSEKQTIVLGVIVVGKTVAGKIVVRLVQSSLFSPASFEFGGRGTLRARKEAMEKPYRVGIEWTNEVSQEEISAKLERMTCFEFIPENFFDNRRLDFLKALKDSEIPVLVHSVEVSFGSMEPLKQEHFDRVKEVAGRVNVANFSDHLSMTECNGVEIGQLTPIPWTIECADHVCRNIEKIQKQIDTPFLIENITNRFLLPNTELTETEFINRILERTGCGFLIDLNNIHTNATNFGFDAREWIDEIKLDQVVAVHLAGGYVDEDGDLVDSHSRPVPEDVYDLYRYLCERIIPPYTIVEWTTDPPKNYEDILSHVDKAEAIVSTAFDRTEPRRNHLSAYAMEAR